LFLLAVAPTVWTRLPLVPVIIRFEDPIGAVAGMETVNVVLVVAVAGVKLEVAP